jgi:ABC-type Fe3+-hydroxamate transport system substrate-binding protein
MINRTVKDALDRSIDVTDVPCRVISLIPSITESLFELGLGDRIVGVSQFCTQPLDRVDQKPRVGGQKNPDHDKIAALQPDLIILNVEENRREDIELLNARYRTFVTFPRRFRDSIGLLEDLGRIFDCPDTVQPFIDAIRVPVESRQRFRALYLIWRKPWMSVNRDTYIHDVLSTFGLDNVCAEREPRYPEITPDDVAAMDPDVILLPDEPFRFRERHRSEVLQWPVRACRNGRVFLVDGSYFCWYGTRAARTADYIAREIDHRFHEVPA